MSMASVLLAAGLAQATLVVRVEGIAEPAGEIRVAVCNGGFEPAGCPHGQWRRPTGAAEEFRFELAPGRYAVAVFHDLNDNDELDRVPPGLPAEPYGFSNDVGRWAPPSFSGALISVEAGTNVVVVRLGRLLG